MSYIDPTEELTKAGGGSDPYAAYKKAGCEPGMFGKRPAATNEVNTSSNSTVDNSNDSLNADQVVSNKEAGAGGAAALIKAAGQSEAGGGKGGSGGGTSSGNGGQPSAFATLSPLAKSATGAVPAEVMKGFLSFPDMETPLVNDQEQRQRLHAAGQIANRHNVHANKNPEAANAGTEMGIVMSRMDTSELQAGAKIMANARLQSSEPNAEDVSSYRGDGFQQD